MTGTLRGYLISIAYCLFFSFVLFSFFPTFSAHLSQRLKGELIVYRSIRRPSVRACVRALTFSNSNISATSGPIVTKFYLKHHWGGGLIALGFGPGRIGTLVSMATNSSHRVIMGKMLCPL